MKGGTDGLEPVVRNVNDRAIEVLVPWAPGELAYRIEPGYTLVPTKALNDLIYKVNVVNAGAASAWLTMAVDAITEERRDF